MKKTLLIALSIVLTISVFGFAGVPAKPSKVKNVIIMIPDGMSIDGTTITRWYYGGSTLNMDDLACGLVSTYNSDTPIADSAPAATAFTTGGHTGEETTLYVYHPRGVANVPTGVIQNTDVAVYIDKLLNLKLSDATSKMFQEAAIAFAQKGASAVKDFSDEENPKLIVTKGDTKMIINRNKNVVNLNGKDVTVYGVAVLSDKNQNWYVPQPMVDLIK
jgi:alkaline phosphatase